MISDIIGVAGEGAAHATQGASADCLAPPFLDNIKATAPAPTKNTATRRGTTINLSDFAEYLEFPIFSLRMYGISGDARRTTPKRMSRKPRTLIHTLSTDGTSE